MLCYLFSFEAVLQGVTENNPTKKEINAEIRATLKHAPVLKFTEEKMFIVTSCKDWLKLLLLASECQKQSHGVILLKSCS